MVIPIVLICVLTVIFILLMIKLTCRCGGSCRGENTQYSEDVEQNADGIPAYPPPEYSEVDVGGRGEGNDWDARSVDTLPRYPGAVHCS